MKQWKLLLDHVRTHGDDRRDRTGIGTRALFGESIQFDLRLGFPAVTTKKLSFGQVVAELAAFLRGCDNLEQFHQLGCSIWDGNGNSDYWKPRMRGEGDLGRIYGVQWRDWRSVVGQIHDETIISSTDQLTSLMGSLRDEPHGRRHLVTAWNPGELAQMCLPPCHVMFQVYIGGLNDERLDLMVYMRSVDLFLGLPFDIASYALLQHLLAKHLSKQAGILKFFLGDAHIYHNHAQQVCTVLEREPLPLPSLHMEEVANLFFLLKEDVSLEHYQHHPAVPAPLNV